MVVVPVHELIRPSAGVVDVGEVFGVSGCVFRGFEPGFGVGVVV